VCVCDRRLCVCVLGRGGKTRLWPSHGASAAERLCAAPLLCSPVPHSSLLLPSLLTLSSPHSSFSHKLTHAGEDDGYLMVYVTKPDGTSYMHIYDAATMDATPLAEVRPCVAVCVWAVGVVCVCVCVRERGRG
jgi:hypothetical protein